VGLAPSKVLAKVGSKWAKPSGLTAIPGYAIHEYLKDLPVEKVWGIGPNTTAFLSKQRISTALQFARMPEAWVTANFPKNFREIWQELHGTSVLKIDAAKKSTYATVGKFKTFTPASSDPAFLFAQLSKNIENACIKVRRYDLAATGALIFVRTHDMKDSAFEVRFDRPTNIPPDILAAVRPYFTKLLRPGVRYRATGVTLLRLAAQRNQLDLFDTSLRIERMDRVFEAVDAVKTKYGKHTLFLGSSFLAHTHAQHEGERGAIPERKRELFKGESKRRRLGIPMYRGRVV
jgi:nucleotidyltransferase/DNA polymerase involved in DNA repair